MKNDVAQYLFGSDIVPQECPVDEFEFVVGSLKETNRRMNMPTRTFKELLDVPFVAMVLKALRLAAKDQNYCFREISIASAHARREKRTKDKENDKN